MRISPRILELKSFMEAFLKQTQGGMNVEEKDKNNMVISVLKTVKFMVSHGFYKTEEELSQIAMPIVELLNGGKSVKKPKKAQDD